MLRLNKVVGISHKLTPSLSTPSFLVFYFSGALVIASLTCSSSRQARQVAPERGTWADPRAQPPKNIESDPGRKPHLFRYRWKTVGGEGIVESKNYGAK